MNRRLRRYLCVPILVALTSTLATASESGKRSNDLSTFRSQVFEADMSYSAEARREAMVRLEALERDADDLSGPTFELEMARIIALADNGHSFHMHGLWTQRYNRLPLEFGVFEDGVFVIHAYQGHEALVGRQLLAINGLDVDELKAAFEPLHPGEPGWKDQFLPFFLESPEVLHAAGLGDNAETASVTLLEAGGAQNTLEFTAASDLPAPEGMGMYIADSHVIDAVRWGQPGTGELPLYLRDADSTFRAVELPEQDALFIQFKSNTGEDIGAFVESVSQQIDTLRPAHIILDQRFNTGGDLNNTRDLMKKLPEDGRTVYAIVSGRTFSAGISSVGYLKQAGGDSVVIIGTPVGDRLEFWAEGPFVSLPESGAGFLVATERHNYMTGCPEDDCHGSIKRHPIAVSSLDPDQRAGLRHVDFMANRDPSMELIETLIRDQ